MKSVQTKETILQSQCTAKSGKAKSGLAVISVHDGNVKGKGKFCICMATLSPEIEKLILSFG